MQAASTISKQSQWGRNLTYFLVIPITAFVIFTLATALTIASYENRHDGRIFTGVTVWGVNLSGMTSTEAQTALANAFPYPNETAVTFSDPHTDTQWSKTPAELGLTFDVDDTIAQAMAVGRVGAPWARLQEMFTAWYAGRAFAPALVFDEGQLDAALTDLAAAVDQPAINAAFDVQQTSADYRPGQMGRQLDVAYLRAQLLQPLTDLRQAEVQLLIHETMPLLMDDTAVAAAMQQMTNPIQFYLQEPLADVDLGYLELPTVTLVGWVRVELNEQADGSMQHHVFVDENAARAWLQQLAPRLYREPQRARFYFDDDTGELVLVAPHVNGRELDVEATLTNLLAHIGDVNRNVPIMLKEVVPQVNASATAADLGITELITETTTWFYGSSDERKHNIARSAANFFGIVVAPGEEFSFNKYLGTVSEDDGYAEGFIIIGGQTLRGIGGGVCQVSTTVYQAAFLAGYPIVERWEHGYMVSYYNDGQGPGMDATVFSPIVDFRFLNNTPYHLLIENYYNTEFEALTFKFYSTSLGRQVEKEGPIFANETAVPGPEQDKWEFNEDLPEGAVNWIDSATNGARVTVYRTVYNANGEVIIGRQAFVSNYVPIPNLFQYGPGVAPYSYNLVEGYVPPPPTPTPPPETETDS